MRSGSLLARSGWRHWLRHPWQAVLAVAGIAMGVTLVVAVDLASQSARAGYLWSTETLAGRATHHVLGPTGNLPDTLYARLRMRGMRDGADRPVPMIPVLEGRVGAGPGGRVSLRLVGMDAVASRDFRAFGMAEARMGEGGPGGGMDVLLTRPGAILLGRERMLGLGLAPGDTLELRAAGRIRRAWVAGFLEPSNRLGKNLVADLAVCDLSAAQEILDRPGRLSRIELDLAGTGAAGSPEADLADKVASMLPQGAELVSVGARAGTLDAMTRAFRVNLLALSLLSLLVGAFLIYNTMAFSVAQRWHLWGTLRSLGVESGEIAGLVCREALVLGGLGTVFGLAGGFLLGRGLVRLVVRTLNDLYFAASVSGLDLDPLVLLKGAVLGLGTSVAASLWPAWQASRIRPRALLTRSSQETRMSARLPLLNRAGAASALACAVLLLAPGRGLPAGFAAMACAILAWCLWTPFLVKALMHGLGPALARMLAPFGAAGSLARLAARDVAASLSRTGVAAAALMTALSITVAMGVMVDSFRKTMREWLDRVLVADVYVAAPDPGTGRPDGRLPPAVTESIRGLPGVEGVTTYWSSQVLTRLGPVHVLAMDMHPRSRGAFRFLEGDPETAWRAFHRLPDCGIFLSEPLAFKLALHAGGTLSLPTAQGVANFAVAGVFQDFGSDRGLAILNRACYERHWEEEGVTSLAVFAAPGPRLDALLARLRAMPEAAYLEFRSHRDIKAASLEIFDRTFAITSVLRLAALLVSLVGLLAALMALAMERSRETALLRALGLTPAQTWGLVAGQTLLLGLAAGLSAIPLGLAQAGILVHVINRRSFGWSLSMHVDPRICAQALFLGLAAALLAGLAPAWKMSRIAPALALREE